MQKICESMGCRLRSAGRANCFGSSLLTTSDVRDFRTKHSITFDTWDVKDIGRRSSSMDEGGNTLKIRTTNERFNWSEKNPCFIDVLKMFVMTGANSKILRILLGIVSGPGDLISGL